MNEELDDAAVTTAVAGYPRSGRDLADGYMLAALVIRAAYDQDDPEIARVVRLYSGGQERMNALIAGLNRVSWAFTAGAMRRDVLQERVSGELADAASTVLLPRVPGEVTQEIRRPCGDHETYRGTIYRCRLLAGHVGPHEADSGVDGDPYLWDWPLA